MPFNADGFKKADNNESSYVVRGYILRYNLFMCAGWFGINCLKKAGFQVNFGQQFEKRLVESKKKSADKKCEASFVNVHAFVAIFCIFLILNKSHEMSKQTTDRTNKFCLCSQSWIYSSLFLCAIPVEKTWEGRMGDMICNNIHVGTVVHFESVLRKPCWCIFALFYSWK